MRAAIVLFLIIPLAAWNAWVAIVLWRWFVVPTFGIPAPGLWTMAGLFVFASMFKARASDLEDDDDIWVKSLFVGAIAPLVALMLGAGFHLLGSIS
jgi:hypothetical protein